MGSDKKKSTSFSVGFMWKEKQGFVCVLPPEDSPFWQAWISRTDPHLRSYHHELGYWIFDEKLTREIEIRFIQAGWVINYHKPYNLHGKQNDAPSPKTFAPTPSFYDLFYLLPTAPKEVIDASYRALIKQTHPDLAQGSKEQEKVLEERAKVLNDAKDSIYKERGW